MSPICGVSAVIMTKKEVAEALRISKKTLERLEAAKKMPPRIQLAGRRVGYRSEDIERLVALSKIDWRSMEPQSDLTEGPSAPILPPVFP